MSVSVAFAVTLLWARDYISLERNYLLGRFSRVRRKLALWGGSMGAGETLLARLWMDIEERDFDAVERSIAAAGRFGLDLFARAWACGHMARMDRDYDGALDYFVSGARATEGLDRAELYLEAALLLLQRLTVEGGDAFSPNFQRAAEYIGQVDVLLDESPLGVGGRERLDYLAQFHRLLRGLLCMGQKRWDDAEARIEEVMRRVKMLHSLRSRRLGQLARIERLPAILARRGGMAFDGELHVLTKGVVLPSLRIRLDELYMMRQRELDQNGGGRGADTALGESNSGEVITNVAEVNHNSQLEAETLSVDEMSSARTPLGLDMPAARMEGEVVLDFSNINSQ